MVKAAKLDESSIDAELEGIAAEAEAGLDPEDATAEDAEEEIAAEGTAEPEGGVEEGAEALDLNETPAEGVEGTGEALDENQEVVPDPEVEIPAPAAKPKPPSKPAPKAAGKPPAKAQPKPPAKPAPAKAAVAAEKKAVAKAETAEAEGAADAAAAQGKARTKLAVIEIDLEKLKPLPLRQRPKSDYDPEKVAEYAKTIKRDGFCDPISVTLPNKAGNYAVVDGECRIAAMRVLGKKVISAIILPIEDATKAALVGYALNFQRSQPDPMSEALFLGGLMKTGQFETQKDLAKSVGKTEARLAQILSRTELTKPEQEELRAGRLTVREAERLIGEKRAAAQKAAQAKPTTAKGGKPSAKPAAKNRVGAPKKKLDLSEMASPSLETSEGVRFVVHRLDSGDFDLDLSLRISLTQEAQPFKAEGFKLLKKIGEAVKVEIEPHAENICVSIESACRRMQKAAKPEGAKPEKPPVKPAQKPAAAKPAAK